MIKTASTILLLLSFQVNANQWGLCPGPPVTGMIPCDTRCFGPAGTKLGATYSKSELSLQNSFYDNANSWVSMNNAYLDYASVYFDNANSSNSKRATALDGVSKTVMGSLDLLSQIKARNVDHFVESYRLIKADFRTADNVRENSKNYSSDRTSPTGDYLLGKIDKHAEQKVLQGKLDIVNELHKDKSNYVDSSEQALLIAQSAHAASDEISIMDFPQFVIDEGLDDESLHMALKSIFALYLKREQINSKDEKINAIKREFALNALSKTLRYINADAEIKSIEDEIYQRNFDVYVSGRNTVALKHALKQEHTFQKALENTLLNSYLKQVKTNNAIKIINNH